MPGIPTITAGTATGAPGAMVSFDVSQDAGGTMVAGIQNDLAFDSVNTPVARTAGGQPDCAVNPAINKNGTVFGFQPPGCTGTACTAFRALVFSFSNVDPLPDQAVLYSCKVNIAPGAPHGSYPLTISHVQTADPSGGVVCGLSSSTPCVLQHGAINVGPSTVVRIDSGTVAPGGMITLPLRIAGANNLGVATIEVRYDPTIVDATGCDFDPNGSFDAGLCNVNFDNDGMGTDAVRVTPISLSGVSGDVLVADVTFAALGAAGSSSSLEVVVSVFADPAGTALPFGEQDGSIGITGPPQPAVVTIDSAAVAQGGRSACRCKSWMRTTWALRRSKSVMIRPSSTPARATSIPTEASIRVCATSRSTMTTWGPTPCG